MTPLEGRMVEVARAIEVELDGLLPSADGPQAQLFEAMRHATLEGGKRFRPALTVLCGDLFDVPFQQSIKVGAAVELVHGYSLVHDDLPAMDDAAVRRGRPSVHRKFGEATAILAGDALLTLAFEVIVSNAADLDPGVRCTLASGLARAAGGEGMCGGQLLDLNGVGDTIETVRTMESLKTGAMIQFSCAAAAEIGKVDERARRAIDGFARELGIAFQISDDLIDATGSSSVAGKDVGLDAASGKVTYVALLGVQGAADALDEHGAMARQHLDMFGSRADLLCDVIDFVVRRTS